MITSDKDLFRCNLVHYRLIYSISIYFIYSRRRQGAGVRGVVVSCIVFSCLTSCVACEKNDVRGRVRVCGAKMATGRLVVCAEA